MKNIPYLIHDFIGWAFYGNNFGIDEILTNKALSTNICKVYRCMISNGMYCIGGHNGQNER